MTDLAKLIHKLQVEHCYLLRDTEVANEKLEAAHGGAVVSYAKKTGGIRIESGVKKLKDEAFSLGVEADD